MILKNIFQIGLFLALLSSCSHDPLDVDSSAVSIKLKYVNLDSAIYNSDRASLINNHHLFQKTIGEIYAYQMGYCLRIGQISDTALVNSISQFKNDKAIQRIEEQIHTKFKDISTYKSAIEDGFRHLKYHFPKGKIPETIVFMNSLFQSNVFCTEKEIGIGLERYLGKENKVIKELPSEPFYEWIKEGMNKEFLERDVLCSWIITHYIPEMEGNLAENIIRWGKILYLTEAAFPHVEKHIIVRYSEEDYVWAVNNQLAFWKYLVNEKLLFKINELDRANLLSEAPFTIGLPEKSPDRFGQFLGWQIVKNYMNNNEITLEQLVKEPYNNILQEYEIEE